MTTPIPPQDEEQALVLPHWTALTRPDSLERQDMIADVEETIKAKLDKNKPQKADYINAISLEGDSATENLVLIGGMGVVGILAFFASAARIYTLSYARLLSVLNNDPTSAQISAGAITALSEAAALLFMTYAGRVKNGWVKIGYYALAFLSITMAISGNITLGQTHTPTGGHTLFDLFDWIVPTLAIIGIGPILEHWLKTRGDHAMQINKLMRDADSQWRGYKDNPKTHPEYIQLLYGRGIDVIIEKNRRRWKDLARADFNYFMPALQRTFESIEEARARYENEQRRKLSPVQSIQGVQTSVEPQLEYPENHSGSSDGAREYSNGGLNYSNGNLNDVNGSRPLFERRERSDDTLNIQGGRVAGHENSTTKQAVWEVLAACPEYFNLDIYPPSVWKPLAEEKHGLKQTTAYNARMDVQRGVVKELPALTPEKTRSIRIQAGFIQAEPVVEITPTEVTLDEIDNSKG